MLRKLWVTGALVTILTVAALLAPHGGVDAGYVSASLSTPVLTMF